MSDPRVTTFEQVWTIGSDPTCDLVLSEPNVSGRHCRLRQTAAGYELEDLGSTNGTYANGRRLAAATAVRPEDRITLGQNVDFPWHAVLSSNASSPERRRTMVDAPAPSAEPPAHSSAAPAGKKPSWLLAGGVLLGGLLASAAALFVVFNGSGDGGPASKDPKELAGYYGHRSAVRALAVSPDGKLVASGDAAGQIAVWEAQSRRERGMLPGQVGSVNSLAISPDSKLVASGGDDSQVRIWNLDKLEKKTTLRGHARAVSSVVFYPAGTHLLSGGRDGRIILWNLSTEKPVRQYSLPAGEVRALAMTPDCLRFVSADSTGLVRVCELSSGRVIAKFKAQQTGVNGLAISPLGDRALVCGNDGTLVLLDLDGKRGVARWSSSDPASPGTSVAFSTGGTRALSADAVGGVRLWSCEDNQLLESYAGHTRGVLCSAFFPNGVVALTGSADESVRLWRIPPPADLEKEKMSEVAEHAKRTAERFARFAGRMTLGREYLDQKKL
ncbi:MAG TPA: FHA domain-containing protein, partial [Pirellulales bacterium]|nr:FHA domain-containing protein [Pirellulales bacterium]